MNQSQQPIIRTVAFFSGRVQGVGFRHHTYQRSKQFDVQGTVENLADGRVKVVVEGRKSEVNAFLDSVATPTAGHVSKVERFESEPDHQFDSFQILR